MKLFWYIALWAIPLSGMVAKRSHFINLCKRLSIDHVFVKEILPEQLLCVDCDGKTILHYATFYDKNGSLIHTVCNACPQLLEQTDNAKYTPLHTAAFHGNHIAVEALLEKKANPSARNSAGKTPAHLVMALNNFATIRLIISALVHAGALINAQDLYGNTPLHILACHANEELYTYVRTQLAFDTLIRNADNYTAEHLFFTAQTPRLAQGYLERRLKIISALK